MKLKRHIAPLGLAFALLGACGSKEKESDAVASTEAQADAESDDASDDASEGAAAEGAAVKSAEPGADDRKRDRGDKSGDAANIRDRRAERLIRRAGDPGATPGGDAAAGGPTLRNPAAEGLGIPGPKLVKPTKPGVEGREGPVEANVAGPAVAVDPGAPSVAEAKTEPPQPTLVKPAGDAGGAPALTETPQPVRSVQPAGNLPAPDVARLLPLVTAAEIVGQKSLKELGPLAGIASVSGYNSLHYATSADRFGVAVQVWNDGTLRETEDRFRRMRLQHPNAEDVEAMKPVKGFYSGYMAIQSLTFIRPDKQMVYTVSCGEGVCDHAKLLRLARAVDGRL